MFNACRSETVEDNLPEHNGCSPLQPHPYSTTPHIGHEVPGEGPSDTGSNEAKG